jgi:carboxyl-terminal processing protease
MKKVAMAALCGTVAGALLTTQVAGPLIAQEATKSASVYEQLDLTSLNASATSMSKRWKPTS